MPHQTYFTLNRHVRFSSQLSQANPVFNVRNRKAATVKRKEGNESEFSAPAENVSKTEWKLTEKDRKFLKSCNIRPE